MKTKNVLYAAVGAPVVAARKMTSQVTEIKGRVSKGTSEYTEAANKAIDSWASEGEKVVTRIGDGSVVEEISQKVDLDQAREQVGKLRDQLEDMLDTWRTSFRPEKAEEKPAAKTSTAKTTTAKKPAAKTSTAKTTTAKKPAAKTSTAKTTKSSSAAKTSSSKSTPAKGGTSKSKTS